MTDVPFAASAANAAFDLSIHPGPADPRRRSDLVNDECLVLITSRFRPKNPSRMVEHMTDPSGSPALKEKGPAPLPVPSNAVKHLPLSNDRRRSFILADVLGAACDAQEGQHRGCR